MVGVQVMGAPGARGEPAAGEQLSGLKPGSGSVMETFVRVVAPVFVAMKR